VRIDIVKRKLFCWSGAVERSLPAGTPLTAVGELARAPRCVVYVISTYISLVERSLRMWNIRLA